mgnify:CR=1 FL=1
MLLKFSALTVIALLCSHFAHAADLRVLNASKESEKSQIQLLAETKTETSDAYTPVYKTDDPHGIVLMMLGVFLVPFSQVLLWKNEKKAVTFA